MTLVLHYSILNWLSTMCETAFCTLCVVQLGKGFSQVSFPWKIKRSRFICFCLKHAILPWWHINPESELCEYVGESLSRLTHRKWMRGGPGKSIHCVSTETIAIQQTQWQPSCLCSGLSVFFGNKNIDVCVNGARSQIFFVWIDSFWDRNLYF